MVAPRRPGYREFIKLDTICIPAKLSIPSWPRHITRSNRRGAGFRISPRVHGFDTQAGRERDRGPARREGDAYFISTMMMIRTKPSLAPAILRVLSRRFAFGELFSCVTSSSFFFGGPRGRIPFSIESRTSGADRSSLASAPRIPNWVPLKASRATMTGFDAVLGREAAFLSKLLHASP